MKSYTDLEQSKKLAEILPLESADYTRLGKDEDNVLTRPYFESCSSEIKEWIGKDLIYPCWSLTALISVLPKEVEIDGQRYAPCLFPIQDKWLLKLWYNSNHTITSPIAIFSDNPIDAYYSMIIKLHKLKRL